MATIDSAKIVRTLLENNGNYPGGDPQVAMIYSYITPEGAHTHAVYWPSAHLSDEIFELMISPFVRDPVLLWSREKGLTAAGQEWLKK